MLPPTLLWVSTLASLAVVSSSQGARVLVSAADVPPSLKHMSAYDYSAALQSNWSTFGKSGNLSELVEGWEQYRFPGMFRIDCPSVIPSGQSECTRPLCCSIGKSSQESSTFFLWGSRSSFNPKVCFLPCI